MNELERLSDAAKALAEVSSASEAWTLARTAEAARRFAQMRGLGNEATNYALGIKAKAMVMLADFVERGQEDGTIARQGNQDLSKVTSGNLSTIKGLLPDDPNPKKTVHDARKLREALVGVDIDAVIAEANAAGNDLGISGLRRAVAAKRAPAEVPEPVAPPAGKYRCIVIDPPWSMPKIDRDVRPNQGVALDYATMTADQLADETWLPVRTSAADECHLYLWVTHKYLPLGLELVEKWGFRYQCVMTWRKNVGITPYSWMYDTEHVLFATRGGLKLTKLGLRLSFDSPTQGHSVKPDVFYDRVREASPGPRLDMFPGVEHEGFEPWGLEASHRGDV